MTSSTTSGTKGRQIEMSIPSIDDFTSPDFNHEVVYRKNYEQGECRRFFLSFAYINERGFVSTGEQIVLAPDLGQAAVRIASERGVDKLFVRKRFFTGRPASGAEIINQVFDVVRSLSKAKAGVQG